MQTTERESTATLEVFFTAGNLPPLARAKGPGRADVTYQRLQRSVFVEGAEDPAPTKLASRVSGELEGSLGEWSRVLSSYRTGSHTHTVSVLARGVGV